MRQFGLPLHTVHTVTTLFFPVSRMEGEGKGEEGRGKDGGKPNNNADFDVILFVVLNGTHEPRRSKIRSTAP